MTVSEDQIKEALKTVKYPGFSRDIVSFGLVKGIDARDGNVIVQLALATNDPAIPQTIKNEAESALRNLAGVREAKVRIDIQAPPTGSGAARVGAKHGGDPVPLRGHPAHAQPSRNRPRGRGRQPAEHRPQRVPGRHHIVPTQDAPSVARVPARAPSSGARASVMVHTVHSMMMMTMSEKIEIKKHYP